MNRGNDRKNMVWNAAAGLLNAAEAVLVMAVVSRTDGIETAGVFSLAFSLANLFMSIGKYGVKEFQVIHAQGHLSFREYLYHRMIFTALMVVIECGYAGIGAADGSMSPQKAQIIALVCLWYTLEAFEDVYLGKHQLEGNLYIGSQQFILRWMAVLSVFCIFRLAGGGIVPACAAAFLAGCIVSVRNILSTNRMYDLSRKEQSVSMRHIAEITWQCLPLFISYFAYFYVNNLPKYMIESYQTDEVQAIYGYLFMPVFAVPLVNSFLYQPKLLETSSYWREGDSEGFKRAVLRQYAIIAGLGVCCMAGAWLLGIPVLSMLYHADLTMYRRDLMVLLAGGALLSAAGYTSVMLTVIGRQNRIIICYGAAIAAELCMCPELVSSKGVSGAAEGFAAAMLILAAAMVVSLFAGMKR